MIKRLIQATVVGYLILALATKAWERSGRMVCGCDSDCWCRRPGLSLFRWVFPRWHKGGLSRRQKMELGWRTGPLTVRTEENPDQA